GAIQLAAQGFEQAVQRMLAGVVGRTIWHRRILRKRAEHDDLSLAGDQAWQRRLGAVQRAVEVDRHDPLEHFQAGVGHTAAMGDAGVVDQHVDAAEAVHYQRNGLLYRRRILSVAAQPRRFSVVPVCQVLNQGIHGVLLQIDDHQTRTRLGHTLGQRTTDPRAAAGDHHDFALEALADKYL